MMQKLVTFLRQWALLVAIVLGAASYFVYMAIPCLAPYKAFTLEAVGMIQPTLLFLMLFVSFCKVEPSHLTPRPWHAWLLLIQVTLYLLLAACVYALQHTQSESLLLTTYEWQVCFEGMMICLICPTATAAAIVTHRLGGSIEALVTYTILINLVVAVAIPAVVPLIHPQGSLGFMPSFWIIMGRVFPMLVCPFFAAFIVRYILPRLHARIVATRNFAFYLWAVSLAMAIAVTTKSMMHSQCSSLLVASLGIGSLLTCVFQFGCGRVIGRRYDCPVSGSQALGQKATVFAIWAGFTFLDPLCSIAGGFYSIWHNLWNTYQLRQRQRQPEHSGMRDKN